MERKESILEKTVQALDLPPDLAGLPRIELLGDRELRVEYHKGILAYGTQEIHISGEGWSSGCWGTGWSCGP